MKYKICILCKSSFTGPAGVDSTRCPYLHEHDKYRLMVPGRITQY